MTELEEELDNISKLLWGNDVNNSEIFVRWCQGIKFSDSDPISLVQEQGGPCAVIAVLQSYLIKSSLFDESQSLSSIKIEDISRLLIRSMTQILENVHKHFASRNRVFVQWSPKEPSSSLDYNHFRQGLSIGQVESIDEIECLLFSLEEIFTQPYTMLTFLYSLLLTVGYNNLKEILEDDLVPMIDPVHGFASQSLINLLVTGYPSQNLFDGEKNIGGFRMVGVREQPEIGFLTIFESSNHCEVGWNLKNPSYPIWVLGSETHLTVLCSDEKGLIQNSASSEKMRFVEQTFKKHSNNDDGSFVSHDQLSTVISESKLDFDKNNLSQLTATLDPEGLGIILLQPFLQYFFPTEHGDSARNQLKKFTLYHFNSLPKSNPNGQIIHHKGSSVILDPQEELENRYPDLKGCNSDIQRCLQTKWPTIRINWEGDLVPSLN